MSLSPPTEIFPRSHDYYNVVYDDCYKAGRVGFSSYKRKRNYSMDSDKKEKDDQHDIRGTSSITETKFIPHHESAAAAAAVVGSIDDLFIEILLRLPVNSLNRFEFLSKHWQSLLKSSQFRRRLIGCKPITLFVGYSSSRSSILCHYVDYVPPFRWPVSNSSTILSPNWFGCFKIKQSCNGLLFCIDQCSLRWFVCNPTTRKVSSIPPMLPQFKDNDDDATILSVTLCFDPAKSPIYKLVSVLYKRPSMYQIYVYSSDTRLWSLSGAQLTGEHGYCRYGGVYWNGAVHWLGVSYSCYFNIEDGVVNTFAMPPKVGKGGAYFGESCNHMYYVESHKPWSCNLYELERDRSKWFLKYQLDLSALSTCYPAMVISHVVSVVHGNEERDSLFLFIRLGKVMVRYNIVSNTFQEIHRFQKHQHSIEVFQHIESSCSV